MAMPSLLVLESVRLLADGKWHYLEWLLVRLMNSGHIHPGQAARRADDTRVKLLQRRHPDRTIGPRIRPLDEEGRVRSGARAMARTVLACRFLIVEKRGDPPMEMVRLADDVPRWYFDYDKWGNLTERGIRRRKLTSKRALHQYRDRQIELWRMRTQCLSPRQEELVLEVAGIVDDKEGLNKTQIVERMKVGGRTRSLQAIDIAVSLGLIERRPTKWSHCFTYHRPPLPEEEPQCPSSSTRTTSP